MSSGRIRREARELYRIYCEEMRKCNCDEDFLNWYHLPVDQQAVWVKIAAQGLQSGSSRAFLKLDHLVTQDINNAEEQALEEVNSGLERTSNDRLPRLSQTGV